MQKRLTGIQIRGEESGLYEVRDGLSALLDALDGSDLAKHRLGNWCSALTIFDPGIRKIFAAFVGMPNNEIYFTRHSHTDKAYVRTPTTAGGEILEVEMEPRDVTLKDAAIGYYGQKPAKLLSMTHSRPRFAQWLTHVSKEMQEKKQEEDCPKMRIYNLAGIPMMVNVVEGYLDAVVEVSGQKCHDVVPGFVIALRAKAVLKDLSNHYITEEEIAARLRDPSQTFSYVLACNEALASELVELLQTVS